MAKKELWLKNNTEADVHLSDLGVKVGKLKTINVYAYNPYITEDKVKLSMESGALSKRLTSETLSVVKKPVSERPHTLDHVKASNRAVEVKKINKTAVVIDTKEMDVLEDDDLGEIADYGLGDLGHENTNYVRTEDGSIVVKQKEDAQDEEPTGAKVSMEVVPSSNMSGQSVVAMTELSEKAVNPIGPVAENASPEQSFVVVKPPEEKNKPTPSKPAVEGKTTVAKDDESGAVVVTGDADKQPKPSTSKYDAHVATKDDSGAVVMKLKEVDGEDNSEAKPADEAKPVKVTKKKTKKATKKKTRKTSKKK